MSMVTVLNMGILGGMPTVSTVLGQTSEPLGDAASPLVAMAEPPTSFSSPSLEGRARAFLKYLGLYLTGRTSAQRKAFWNAVGTKEFGGISVPSRDATDILREVRSLEINDGTIHIPPRYSDPQKAAQLLEEAYRLVDSNENPKLALAITAPLGPIYHADLDNSILSLGAYKRAARHAEVAGDKFQSAFNGLNVAAILLELGLLVESARWLEKTSKFEKDFNPVVAQNTMAKRLHTLKLLENRQGVVSMRISGAEEFYRKLGAEDVRRVAQGHLETLRMSLEKNEISSDLDEGAIQFLIEEADFAFYLFRRLGDLNSAHEAGLLRIQIMVFFDHPSWAATAAEELLSLLPENEEWEERRQSLNDKLAELRSKSQLN